MDWTCKTCWVTIPLQNQERIRKHLRTKRHKRYENACPKCQSLRMERIKGETWDRDGLREALKCQRCRREYYVHASGIYPKTPGDYTGELPADIQGKLDAEFDELARSRGYIRASECEDYER